LPCNAASTFVRHAQRVHLTPGREGAGSPPGMVKDFADKVYGSGRLARTRGI